MTEKLKINHFHSLLRKRALQALRNINSINRQTLDDLMAIFRKNYAKLESKATAKHKWHRLTFNPSTLKLSDFLGELNQGANNAFGENAKNLIDSLLAVCETASKVEAICQHGPLGERDGHYGVDVH